MDESEENMSSDDRKNEHSSSSVKGKPKKRSLVERELETSLTAKVTSPMSNSDSSSTSRYGRARRVKSDNDYWDTDTSFSNALATKRLDNSPAKSPNAYKMHAMNSPVQIESPQKIISIENKLENTIENIYNANISLSRFGSDEKKNIALSPAKKFPKIYMRKDIIQTKEKIKEKEETVTLIKNMFSPIKPYKPPTKNSHLSNILERSAEKYNINRIASKPHNGLVDPSSVVKTLDFDGNKKKRKENGGSKPILANSNLFDLEAKCEYQVGDLAWARVGTYPFWPCIITREPSSELFVKRKLFGRIERNVMHVTFFGDNGRRSWLVDTMLRKFLGQLEFEATRDQFTPEAKRKAPKLYAAFFISEKKQALWNTSVEEAEALLREPKRLRIDLFYDMLCKTMTVKPSSKGQKVEKASRADDIPKISRMDSDVSLSESLFDTLFSDDDGKAEDNDRPKNKRHKSLDVSEVVTACLDNMAAKTGITKIQKQSHMDRWLQKAKSNTPEKSQIKVTVKVEKVDEKKENVKEKEKEIKVKDSKKKKKALIPVVPLQKPYSFRKPSNESRNLLSHHNEHDYSCKLIESKDVCFDKLDKFNATVKVNQTVDMSQNEIASVTNYEKICEENIVQESLVTTVVKKDILKENNEAEQGSLTIINKDNTSKLEIGIEADQSLRYIEDVIPPDTETSNLAINDDSSSKMEVDRGVRDKKFQTEESKTCDHLVPSDNLNLSNASNLMLPLSKINNTDRNIKKTDERQSPEVTEDILCVENFRDDITFNKVPINETNNSKDTVLAKGKKLTSINRGVCVDKYYIINKSDRNVIDTEMSTDDDITICDSDVDTTDFVLDTIDKMLTENETTATISEGETKQNEAKDIEIKNLVVEVCNDAKENIECKDNKISAQEKNEDDYKFCEPVNNCIHDEVLNNSLENTFEGKLTQSVKTPNISQDNKAIDGKNTQIDVDKRVLNGKVREIVEQDQPQSIQTDSENKTTLSSNNLTQNVTNNPIENIKENGFTKNLVIEVIKEEWNLDNNSLISDVSIKHNIIPLSNKPSEPVVNGFHVKDHMKKIKNVQDPDTASVCSDDVTLNELKLSSKIITSLNEVDKMNQKIETIDEDDLIESDAESQAESEVCNLPKIGKISSAKNFETKINVNNFLGSEVLIKKRKLRLRKSNSPSVVIKENGPHDSKCSSPDVTIKEELDPETVSISSEDSNVYIAKLKNRRNSMVKTEDKTKDPTFLKYLEATQDALMDEHPELTYDEIVSYLYKSWSYKESCIKKSVETEESHELQNVKEESSPPKRTNRKINNDKKKLINIEKVLAKEPKKLNHYLNNIPRDKPRRKTVQPYYNEDYSDIEDEIQMFEIFKKKPKIEPGTEVPTTSKISKYAEDVKLPIIVNIKTEAQTDNQEGISIEEYYDEVEAYFDELTQPKPNVFKGLVREKVCEICEKTTNLVKCKKCNNMFHVECVKQETEVIEIPAPVKVRGRKKKKKPTGCKTKTSTDSNGLDSESQSDEKSQDLSASDERNMSVDEMKDPDCYIVADAETFEAQLANKMKEMLETADIPEYDSYSSDDGLDWSDTVAGKCEIVNINLKPKRVEYKDFSDFKCNNCQKYDTPLCFVCKLPVSPKDQSEHRQRCQVPHCHKYYHLKCLDQWPQTQFSSGEPSRNNKKISEHFETLSCPRHVCHTCVCDDPRGCKTRFSGDKLARCVKCPATYHSFTKCLPAGSQILTASHIICPRHYKHRPGKVPCHVNTGWCFICALGGSLICCEYCPTSFHAECLNIKPPEGGYMCEDCETGRLPLYGEMVWVKLGHYRWWPGIVLHPCEIPDNIMAVKHTLGEFVVRFFGQYDHYWVNRGRVFPFQEGDSGRISSQKSKIDEAFTLAIQHAQRAFEILKSTKSNEEESLDIASSLLPPHYVKLKVNKPCGSLCGRRIDIEESSLTQCECNPDEEDPCGPYSHCLNRMLLTECGTSCRAGERCNNRAFEKRLYPKLTPYRTPHRGWGLKTLEDVKAGQFVIEYVGELIDEEEFKRRMNRKHEIRDENFYFLTLDKERMIDAGPKGNLARFMNHCCEPNCETQKWTVLGDVRVGLFAIRDIPANSEVTFNYNLECAGIDKKRCLCGAKRCSGYIGAKPKQDETQPKRPKLAAKRTYKKRKNPEESPSTSKNQPKRPVGRPRIEKPRELTEIEKDLLIIKNAINGLSSDSECSGRLSSIDVESEKKDTKALKRKRVDFSTEEVSVSDCSLNSPSGKKVKMNGKKRNIEVGD